MSFRVCLSSINLRVKEIHTILLNRYVFIYLIVYIDSVEPTLDHQTLVSLLTLELQDLLYFRDSFLLYLRGEIFLLYYSLQSNRESFLLSKDSYFTKRAIDNQIPISGFRSFKPNTFLKECRHLFLYFCETIILYVKRQSSMIFG